MDTCKDNARCFDIANSSNDTKVAATYFRGNKGYNKTQMEEVIENLKNVIQISITNLHKHIIGKSRVELTES